MLLYCPSCQQDRNYLYRPSNRTMRCDSCSWVMDDDDGQYQRFDSDPDADEGVSTQEGPKDKTYNIPLITAFSRTLKAVKQNGQIGIEIECEGSKLWNKPIQYWTCHEDGSLRNSTGGENGQPLEYVLQKPLDRPDVSKALSYLCSKLKAHGSVVDELSPRTSVHVHINCQQLTMKQIVQFVCLYLIFEDALVRWSGPDRIGNLFCLRAKDAEYFTDILEEAVRTENYNQLFDENFRYMSCNMTSLGKFGSLEFRSLRGTVDQEIIEKWVDILLELQKIALSYGSPAELADDIRRQGVFQFYRSLKNSVLPPLVGQFSCREEFEMSLKQGYKLMRDVAYSVKWKAALPVTKETKLRPQRKRVRVE